MRRLLIFALATIATTLLALPMFKSSAGAEAPVSVIVELRDDPGAVYKAKLESSGGSVSSEQLQTYRGQLRANQNQFLDALRNLGINAQLKTVNVPGPDGNVAGTIEFRYSLVYNGLALNVPASAISTIKGMNQVKGVHANTVYSPQLDHSVAYVRAPEVYGAHKDLTQFDDSREGHEGQGMKVAVIDTGITWSHAMFGGDPTPPRFGLAPPTPAATNSNQKVIYYLPLIEALVDDYGHGTHVSGDIAGYLAQDPGPDMLPNTGDDIRMHGVAPQAKLMGYKVCSGLSSSAAAIVNQVNASTVPATGAGIPYPVRRCESSSIIMAIEDSVSPFTLTGQPKPVADIINMSLGGGGGPDEPSAVASDNAVLAGSIVVASAGNSGPGESTVGSPAAGRRVIAAGANNDPGIPAVDPILDAALNNGEPPNRADVLDPSSILRNRTGLVDGSGAPDAAGQRTNISALRMGGAPPIANPVAQYYVFAGTVQSAADVPDSVSGRIAIARPSGAFGGVVAALAAKGAAGAILIRADLAKITAGKTTIPAWSMIEADARYLLDLLSSTDAPGVDPAKGTLSDFPIRVKSGQFSPAMASFSSRGPIQGFGQVKPDVTAPGVGIRSATTSVGVPVFSMQSITGFTSANGTSFSGPHVAGAATLIKQAHPDWNADMVRTALINTATNLRQANGAPKAGGLDGDSVNMQGGGLIDIKEAVNAKALMGVAGDGITQPTILGSHSYGAVPVVNSRVTHTTPVTVTIRDVSGEGGNYSLTLENNRDLQLNGVGASLSATSVSVPANGSATFTVNATVDGDLIRSITAAKVFGDTTIFEPIQMQWYVSAQRADGKESLRMPFYLKPSPSLPANSIITEQHFEGVIVAGDAGQQTSGGGVNYEDIPFEVAPGTYRVEARLDYITQEAQDMDLYLLDPAGHVVKTAGIFGGPEILSAEVEQPGTYKYRVVGYANGPVTYTLDGKLTAGPPAPISQTISGDYVNAQGQPVDFDGSVTLQWTPTGGEQGFEIERSSVDNPDWQIVAGVGTGSNSFALNNLSKGTHSFRVRGIHPGKIGKYITTAGNTVSVLVDQRTKVDITSQVTSAMSNVSLTGGVFQLDLNMTNNSAQSYLPLVDLNVVGITSTSGTVKAINADNGGNGKSVADAALFGYSQQLGADETFTPSEVSGVRTLRFQDSASEMFSFDVVVTAYLTSGGSGTSGGASAAPSGGSQAPPSGPGGGTGPLNKFTAVMRFTANPLTKNVVVQLVSLKP
jgi:subtilisin family serine protease